MEGLFTYFRKLHNTYRKNRYAIRPYLLKDGKKHPVAVICPGGSYRRVCSFVEGHPFARTLNAMGYHAVVVFYRTKELARFPNPQDDLARALRELQENAERWNLDMTGYSLWGSSAGGHLAASFGTESMGYSQYHLPKPGAMILAYPVVTMGARTHRESRRHLLGDDPSPEKIRETSVELQVTDAYPPTFLWWGSQDSSVDPENSRMLCQALEEHHIPCRCREYPDTGHGVGLGQGLPCEGWIADAVAFWETYRT